MKYTPQQREELLRLFDARAGSIHEFAIQHKVNFWGLSPLGVAVNPLDFRDEPVKIE